MFLIGLTGGIGSGKSTVAKRFIELGAVHIDADVLAREVVAPGTAGLDAIRAEFGDEVIDETGALNRPALGAIVFRDPEKLAALNAITHPAVWARTRELITEAESADPDAVVLYDVPLLVEGSNARQLNFDLIVVVQADEAIRVERLAANRGMAEEEAIRRIRSQATDAERAAVADVVIDNNGSFDQTTAQVDAVWQNVRSRSAQA